MGGSAKSISGFSKNESCHLCHTNILDEYMLGPIYKITNITLHYYCLLMASRVEQKGTDKQGLLGFFAKDIKKEIERGSKLVCVFCHKNGATIECCGKKCKKVFHLPCGQAKGSIHQFFKEFKSFCGRHRPMQAVPASLRKCITPITCMLCAETISLSNSYNYLWPICCKANSLFHRECVQKMACTAGFYHFRCPLCNNSEHFQNAMHTFGIYIPEREAAWEREPNAFSELLDRYNSCDAEKCLCPKGRNFIKGHSDWHIELCELCGSSGVHRKCSGLWNRVSSRFGFKWNCPTCTTATSKVPADRGKQLENTMYRSDTSNPINRDNSDEDPMSSTNSESLSEVQQLISVSDSEDEIVNVEDLSSDEMSPTEIRIEEEVISCTSRRQSQQKRRKNSRPVPSKKCRLSLIGNQESQSSIVENGSKMEERGRITRSRVSNKSNLNRENERGVGEEIITIEDSSEGNKNQDCLVVWTSIKVTHIGNYCENPSKPRRLSGSAESADIPPLYPIFLTRDESVSLHCLGRNFSEPSGRCTSGESSKSRGKGGVMRLSSADDNSSDDDCVVIDFKFNRPKQPVVLLEKYIHKHTQSIQ